MIQTAGIELCTESFGDPGEPPVLLIMGLGASMLWWEEGFCRMLAGGGRFVIRYDHRDTGRSVTYEPGRPGYTGGDLVADAAGILDAYGIPAAHIAGPRRAERSRSSSHSTSRGAFVRSSSSAPPRLCPATARSRRRTRSSGASRRPRGRTGPIPGR